MVKTWIVYATDAAGRMFVWDGEGLTLDAARAMAYTSEEAAAIRCAILAARPCNKGLAFSRSL